MAKKIRYPRDRSFIDRQGNLVHPSREDFNARKSKQVGTAYAFFDCDASAKEIEKSMPDIRHDARTPKGLQMLLYEGISELKLDKSLAKAIKYPDDYRIMTHGRIIQGYEEERRPLSSLKYTLVADCKGDSNEDVANELGNVMNVIYRRFNRDQEMFRGAIAYEKDGEYHLME